MKILFCLLTLMISSPVWPQQSRAAQEGVIVVLGDSLSAGYQLPAAAAWPALLEQQLHQSGENYRVVNAGISGDTTAGGLSRLPTLLSKYHPDLLIVELGANDGLRGLSLEQARSNLARILELALAADSRVLLVGMQIPLNFGPRYSQQFRQMFPELAEQYGVALMPFLFVSIHDQPEMFLPDMLHPNEAGQRVLMVDVFKNLLEHGLISSSDRLAGEIGADGRSRVKGD